MDFANPRQRRAFFDIHRDLPREGPGNRASTLRALAFAGPVPPRPRILDVACGPGAQTLDLAAALPDAAITALDAHAPYLKELRLRADEAGVGARTETIRGDMRKLVFDEGAFDMIWCEGAAYILGVPEALRSWRRLLRPGGRLALTEPVWLRSGPFPAEVEANWAEYPSMTTIAGVHAWFREAGYRLLGDFVLPPEAWWTDYYSPMERRLALLQDRYADDPEAAAVLREARDEITCYRKHSNLFGYAFFVGAPAG